MKPYKAKSLKSAEREVRHLRRLCDRMNDILDQYDRDRLTLAKLAADTPQFFNPLLAMEAKDLRDRILKRSNAA